VFTRNITRRGLRLPIFIVSFPKQFCQSAPVNWLKSARSSFLLSGMLPLLIGLGCSCCYNPATWRMRGSKAQEENAGRGINGGDPTAQLRAAGAAAVYAAKARILFLCRASAEPLGTTAAAAQQSP
jgi:hypothetical protein